MRSEVNRKWWGFTKTTDKNKNIQEELHRWFYRTMIGAARHSVSCQQMITCQTAFSKGWRKWVPGGLWMVWSRVYIVSRWGYVWVLHPQWPPDCIIGPFDISDSILLFIVNTIPVTSMEKVIAPYSSTLAWNIPWTEEHGRLQSMGSLRVGHDWSDLAAAAASYVQGPSKNEEENSFTEGKRKSGGLCKQRVLGFSLAESFQERSFLFLLGLCYHYRTRELPFLVCRLCSVESLFNNFFQSSSQKAQRWKNIG